MRKQFIRTMYDLNSRLNLGMERPLIGFQVFHTGLNVVEFNERPLIRTNHIRIGIRKIAWYTGVLVRNNWSTQIQLSSHILDVIIVSSTSIYDRSQQLSPDVRDIQTSSTFISGVRKYLGACKWQASILSLH